MNLDVLTNLPLAAAVSDTQLVVVSVLGIALILIPLVMILCGTTIGYLAPKEAVITSLFSAYPSLNRVVGRMSCWLGRQVAQVDVLKIKYV